LENLGNVIDLVEKFERKIRKEEIRRVHIRKKKVKECVLNPEAEMFKRSKLPGKYTTKILFEWDDRKFEDKYLKKLDKMERKRETSSSRGRTLREYYYGMLRPLFFFSFSFIYFSFLFLFFFFFFFEQ